MPGKYYSNDLKSAIIHMSEQGMSKHKIAASIGKPRSTVIEILKRNSERGTIKNKSIPGTTFFKKIYAFY